MTELQYEMLDLIYYYKSVAKIKNENEVKGEIINGITKEELFKNFNKYNNSKIRNSFDCLLKTDFLIKKFVLVGFEVYLLTDLGEKEYLIEKANITRKRDDNLYKAQIKSYSANKQIAMFTLLAIAVSALFSFLTYTKNEIISIKELQKVDTTLQSIKTELETSRKVQKNSLIKTPMGIVPLKISKTP